MSERWYKHAVIYCVDVHTFQDTNDDGVGDLPGLTSRLDYLARLGVTTLWLNPIHPSPMRDDGYDVTDHYGIHPRLGSIGDFVELIEQADSRGIRVIIDLVVNHTSDEHPWFQSARSDPGSPFHGWYVWSEHEPAEKVEGVVFPGEQESNWTWDERAGAWYFHRFYDFQPDLNWANPRVREEIKKVVGFWLKLGVAGFRMDAVPFVIDLHEAGRPLDQHFEILTELRERMRYRRGDSIVLAEANVAPADSQAYFSSNTQVCDRLPMLFNFALNGASMLALARGDAEPITDTLGSMPPIPPDAQWATFMRNHDEVDLSKLTPGQREEVFAAFGPEPEMRLYGRGIRRRLAPMLGNDRRRLELAYSVQFSLPGTPVLRYGEEIGMGDNLSLPGRDAIRTPMQWNDGPAGGFSAVADDECAVPPIRAGDYGYQHLNVVAQEQDPASLLTWFERMIRILRECPEAGEGVTTLVTSAVPRHVLAHLASGRTGTVLFLHNLADIPVTLDLGPQPGQHETDPPVEVFSNRGYDRPDAGLKGLRLDGYGYRWIRLARAVGGLG